jgi:hypothetical protein
MKKNLNTKLRQFQTHANDKTESSTSYIGKDIHLKKILGNCYQTLKMLKRCYNIITNNTLQHLTTPCFKYDKYYLMTLEFSIGLLKPSPLSQNNCQTLIFLPKLPPMSWMTLSQKEKKC